MEVPKWEEYFMMSACLASKRSKDPITKVGSVIVNEHKHIISSGYNGFPNGIADNELSWEKNNKDPLQNKNMYVVHAELNAILNCTSSPRNCVMYCTLKPCSECCKAIIQAGIKTVIYANEPRKIKDTYKAAEKMFLLAGVKVKKYTGLKKMSIEL